MAVSKTEKGASLKRWFKEEWTDVSTGKPCGRSKGESRGTPYCRPQKEYHLRRLKQLGKCQALKKVKK